MDQVSSIRKANGAVHVSFISGATVIVPLPLFALRPLRSEENVERDGYVLWLRDNEYPHALALAVRYLADRERSRMEVCARLKSCGYSPEATCRVADYLIKRGLLSDSRLAGLYVQSRAARIGRLRIQQDLKRKGIDSETVAAAVASLDEETQTDKAVLLASQYAARNNRGDPRTLHRRIVGMLMRRGFTFTQCKHAASKAAPFHGDLSEEDV